MNITSTIHNSHYIYYFSFIICFVKYQIITHRKESKSSAVPRFFLIKPVSVRHSIQPVSYTHLTRGFELSRLFLYFLQFRQFRQFESYSRFFCRHFHNNYWVLYVSILYLLSLYNYRSLNTSTCCRCV